MKIFFLILFLITMAQSLFAQEVNSDSTRIVKQLSDSSVVSIQPRGCVSIFENKTVTVSETIIGCTTLSVKNVTITNTGNLTLAAPQDITINGIFEVQQGGVLNVYRKDTPLILNFIYDASGNRIRREIGSNSSSITSEEEIQN